MRGWGLVDTGFLKKFKRKDLREKAQQLADAGGLAPRSKIRPTAEKANLKKASEAPKGRKGLRSPLKSERARDTEGPVVLPAKGQRRKAASTGGAADAEGPSARGGAEAAEPGPGRLLQEETPPIGQGRTQTDRQTGTKGEGEQRGAAPGAGSARAGRKGNRGERDGSVTGRAGRAPNTPPAPRGAGPRGAPSAHAPGIVRPRWCSSCSLKK